MSKESKAKHVRMLRELCEKYELDGRVVLDYYSDWDLAGIYNGLGSDGMPAWLREAATFLSPDLEPTALVHDVDYHRADGTREGFDAANKRFKVNGRRTAKKLFAWYDPRRYALMNRARRYGNYCQMFGWKAWKSPSE